MGEFTEEKLLQSEKDWIPNLGNSGPTGSKGCWGSEEAPELSEVLGVFSPPLI